MGASGEKLPKGDRMRTKARDSEDQDQRQDVLGVVQDRTEAGAIRAGMRGEEGGVGRGGARGWGGATLGKALWMVVKTLTVILLEAVGGF